MEPRRVKYSLGALSQLQAEAFGQPGHRTFRLALQAGAADCIVWLEKEQLFQLGVYVQEVIQSLSAEDRQRASAPKEPEWPGARTSIDFKAGQLSLSHDAASNCFYLQAHQAGEQESREDPSSVSFWITVAQGAALAEEALRVCAAGRPLCFLCGLPINPEGHVCPRSNGHIVFEAG